VEALHGEPCFALILVTLPKKQVLCCSTMWELNEPVQLMSNLMTRNYLQPVGKWTATPSRLTYWAGFSLVPIAATSVAEIL